MQKKREERLLDLFRKMAEKDKLALEAFADASVKENPKKTEPLRLIVGGRRAA